jgi:hypothetical protein
VLCNGHGSTMTITTVSEATNLQYTVHSTPSTVYCNFKMKLFKKRPERLIRFIPRDSTRLIIRSCFSRVWIDVIQTQVVVFIVIIRSICSSRVNNTVQNITVQVLVQYSSSTVQSTLDKVIWKVVLSLVKVIWHRILLPLTLTLIGSRSSTRTDVYIRIRVNT